MTENDVVEFDPIDAVHARISASPSIRAEIRDAFTFEAPGARYSPQYKRGHWDGQISLFKHGRLYRGLEAQLRAFCEKRSYQFYHTQPGQGIIAPSDDEIEDFIESLDIPDQFNARDYQLDAFRKATAAHRALFLSPTSSGKSLMAYHLVRWHETKTLIIVPTVTLVHQMAGDFIEYGFHPDNIHTIVAGSERITDRPVVISTWQSVIKMLDSPQWFDQFGMVIGDEAHKFQAKSLVAIMEFLPNCHLRYGFTGSLDGSKCNALTLEGLFGPIHEVTTTKKLMDQGMVSQLHVNVIILKHPDRIRKIKRKYPDEINHLIACFERNQFITDLVLNIKGNTLLLYHRVEHHGKVLTDMLMKKTDRPIYFIHGGVDGKVRNDTRAFIEDQNNAIIVASFGTFATGINIKKLHNIVMAASFKSRIVNLQSVGRGLRLSKHKTHCDLFDVTDDMTWKSRDNYTLQHAYERIKLYAEQSFEYQLHKINLEY